MLSLAIISAIDFLGINLSGVNLHGITFHPIALLVSERVVSCLIAGSILTACAGLALRLMQRQNARTKFALCLATLAAIAAVPLLGWFHAQQAAGAQAGAPVLRLPGEWAAYIFAVWVVGASIALGRVVLGLYRVWQVRRSCVPVASPTVDVNLRNALSRFQSERRVELCTSELVRVPTAIGFWRPAVALPSWCLRDLSSDELYSVVLHELEHLRRFDDWTNLFQRVVGALFFFHPAVWWLESRLSLEREMACDDAVLAVVPDPKSYARCLLSLAEKSYLRRGIALAQAAVSRVQQLTARVTQILSARRPGTTALWKPALSIVVVTAFVGGASVEVAPRLVSFETNAAFEGNAAANTLMSSAPVEAAPTLVNAAGRAFDDGHLEHEKFGSELRATPAKWVAPVAQKLRPVERPKPTNGLPDGLKNSNATADAAQNLPVAPVRVADAERQPGKWATSEHRVASPASAEMLVMVVHSEERYESGDILWSVRVVRWIVWHPQAPKQVTEQETPAKT